jgi:1-deoxyxylulose-5-phosphate synthase
LSTADRLFVSNQQHFGVGAIPWSPLAKGTLTRPWTETSHRGSTDPIQRAQFGDITPEHKAINEAIEKIAKARGYSMAQVSSEVRRSAH